MPLLVADREQQVVELGGFARIEAGGRLVEAQQRRVGAHARARSRAGAARRRAALPASQSARSVRPIRSSQCRARSTAARSARAVARQAEQAGEREDARRISAVVLRDDQIFEHGHAGEEPDVLEGARDPGVARDAEPVHALEQQDASPSVCMREPPDARPVEAGEAVEDRGLAGAVRADDRGDLARATAVKERSSTATSPPKRMVRCSTASSGLGARPSSAAAAPSRSVGSRCASSPRGRHTMIADHRRAEEQHAELGEVAAELGQGDQHDRREHDADLAAHAAEHDDGEDGRAIR